MILKHQKLVEFDKLIVPKKIKFKGIGEVLLTKMEDYFKSINCQRILIKVFSYNKSATNFSIKTGVS